MSTQTMKKIGVIGAGTMGRCISIDLVLHNLEVVLVDLSQEVLKDAEAEINKNARFLPLVNKDLPVLEQEKLNNSICYTTELSMVKDCDFIIENITEDLDKKASLYKALDACCPPHVCFGVNTSCISITEVGAVTKRPQNFVGMHFMNPSYLKPCIEVIRGFHTTDETLATAQALLDILNKEAVVVNDLPGFVTNRISHLFMNEAAFVVQDQVADPKQVDDIFKKCYGHTMGPLETADLIGLDTVAHSLDVLYNSYQDSKYRCCPLLKKMVAAGYVGRKSGKGFYEYGKK